MPMPATVGVIHPGNLSPILRELGRPPLAGDLADLARVHRLPQLWVHADAHRELGIPRRLPPNTDPGRRAREGHPSTWVSGGAWTFHPPGLSGFLVARQPGLEVDLGLAAFDEAAGLQEASPAQLQAALELYRLAVGLPYRWSPGATGCRLITALHRNGRPLGRSTSTPPPPAMEPGLESDFRWVRPLTAGEARAPYVHAFDANARYLASCAGLELGLGEPTYVVDRSGDGLNPHGRILPGYYRAVLGPMPAELPDPFDPHGAGRPGWYTAPTLELAQELGAVQRITEAWVWRDHSRYLVPWYTQLRAARAELQTAAEAAHPGAAFALGLVKRTYTMTIGYLAGHFREPGDQLHRPDWRHAIVARSRVNLYRRLRKAGVAPFAVEVDAVYVASDNADPAAVGLPLGRGLGELKHVGTARLADLPGLGNPARSAQEVGATLELLREAVA